MQPQPKQITVKVTRAFMLNGAPVEPNTVATYDRGFAAELITNQKAVTHDDNPATKTEPAGEQQVIAAPTRTTRGQRHDQSV